MRGSQIAVLLSAVVACSVPVAQAETKALVVEAGKQARAHVPMCVALPQGVETAKLVDKATGAVAAQAYYPD